MASFITASAFSTLAGLVSLSFGFLCSIAIARLLGPDGSGAIAFSLWLTTTMTLVAGLGISHILNRYMPRYDRPGNPGGGLTRVLFPYFAIPVALTTLGFAGYGYVFQNSGGAFTYTPETWMMIALFFAVFSLASIAEASARGLNRFDETGRLVFIGCLLQLPCVLIGAYFFGVPGALAGYVARYIPQLVKLSKYIKTPAAEGVVVQPKMRAHARNEWFSDIMGLMIWGRIEILFLGLYFSTTEIGYYAAGLTLSNLVVQLPTQMVAALTPHMGRHHDNDDVQQINLTYQRVLRWITLMMMPICFGGAAVIPVMLPLLFGPEFTAAIPMAIIIVASALSTALSMVPSLTISARERSSFFLYSTPTLAILSVGILALVVPSLGGEGAAWVRAGIHTIWLLWLVLFCWFKLDVKFDVWEMTRLLSAGIACTAAAHFTLSYQPSIWGLGLAIASGAVAYLISLRLLKCIPAEDISAIEANLPKVIPAHLQNIAIKSLYLLAPAEKRSQND